MKKEELRYFVIIKCNCGTSADTTNIIGLTTDEEFAKSKESLFCRYEEVKMIKNIKNE